MQNRFSFTTFTTKKFRLSRLALVLLAAVNGVAYAAADITIKVADASHVTISSSQKEIAISIHDTAVVDAAGLLDAKPTTRREAGKLIHTILIANGENASVNSTDGGKVISIKIEKSGAAIKDKPDTSAPAVAAQKKDDANKKAIAAYIKKEAAWAVPSSPAFDLIGASPNLANLPKAPRDIAAHLVTGRAVDGSFQKGIAIDASLYQLLMALPILGTQFADSWAKTSFGAPNMVEKAYLSATSTAPTDADAVVAKSSFVNRLKISFATTQEEGKTTGPIQLGLGFHYTIWDYADKKLACQDPEKKTENTEAREAVVKDCEADRKKFFAKPAAAIGYGRSYTLADGKWENRVSGTKGLWFTAATGSLAVSSVKDDLAAPRAQLVFHHRWFKDQNTAAVPAIPAVAATATSPAIAAVAAVPASKQDTKLWAARLKIGQPDGGFSYEYARGTRKPLIGAREKTSRQAYGFEWKVGKDTWLVASAGKETSSISGAKNQPFVVTTLRFGGEAASE